MDVVLVVKMASIVAAVVCLNVAVGLLLPHGSRRDEASMGRAKSFAVSMLVLWTIAVIGGQLTNYSNAVLAASVVAFAVVVGNAVSMVVAGRRARRLRAAIHDSRIMTHDSA